MFIVWDTADPALVFSIFKASSIIFTIAETTSSIFVAVFLGYVIIYLLMINERQKKMHGLKNLAGFFLVFLIFFPSKWINEEIIIMTPRAFKINTKELLPKDVQEELNKTYLKEEQEAILEEEVLYVPSLPITLTTFLQVASMLETLYRDVADYMSGKTRLYSRGFLTTISQATLQQFSDKIKDPVLTNLIEEFYGRSIEQMNTLAYNFSINNRNYNQWEIISGVASEVGIVNARMLLAKAFSKDPTQANGTDESLKAIKVITNTKYLKLLYNYLQSDNLPQEIEEMFLEKTYVLLGINGASKTITFVPASFMVSTNESTQMKYTYEGFANYLKKEIINHIRNVLGKDDSKIVRTISSMGTNANEAWDFLIAGYFYSHEPSQLLKDSSMVSLSEEKSSIVKGLATSIEANKISVLTSKMVTTAIVDVMTLLFFLFGPFIVILGVFFAPKKGWQILTQSLMILFSILVIRPVSYYMESIISSYTESVVTAKEISGVFGISDMYSEAVIGDIIALNYVFVLLYLIIIYFLISSFKGADVLGDLMGRFIPSADRDISSAISGNFGFDQLSVGNKNINVFSEYNTQIAGGSIGNIDRYVSEGYKDFINQLEGKVESGRAVEARIKSGKEKTEKDEAIIREAETAKKVLQDLKEKGYVSYNTKTNDWYVNDKNLQQMAADSQMPGLIRDFLQSQDPAYLEKYVENKIREQELYRQAAKEYEEEMSKWPSARNTKPSFGEWLASKEAMSAVLQSLNISGSYEETASGSSGGGAGGTSASSGASVSKQTELSAFLTKKLLQECKDLNNVQTVADVIKQYTKNTGLDDATVQAIATKFVDMRNTEQFGKLKKLTAEDLQKK